MDGMRHEVEGADGVPIGLLTAGEGPPLLLVHGGVGQIERWAPLWDLLTDHRRVTAMDRRGRGSSGDGVGYTIEAEYGDVAAVVRSLAEASGCPVDVFAHSYGATCALGAARLAPPVGHLVLYEPPGPETVTPEFVDRVTAWVEEGRAGRAMAGFLTEIIGLSEAEVDELRATPVAYDILAVLAATLPREGRALLGADVTGSARAVTCPTLLLLGERSPAWAGAVTEAVAALVPGDEVTPLPGLGHEAIDAAPGLVVDLLDRFLG
jgi:pimeloyl-ACP methyl ester carboxylesterase